MDFKSFIPALRKGFDSLSLIEKCAMCSWLVFAILAFLLCFWRVSSESIPFWSLTNFNNAFSEFIQGKSPLVTFLVAASSSFFSMFLLGWLFHIFKGPEKRIDSVKITWSIQQIAPPETNPIALKMNAKCNQSITNLIHNRNPSWFNDIVMGANRDIWNLHLPSFKSVVFCDLELDEKSYDVDKNGLLIINHSGCEIEYGHSKTFQFEYSKYIPNNSEDEFTSSSQVYGRLNLDLILDSSVDKNFVFVMVIETAKGKNKVATYPPIIKNQDEASSENERLLSLSHGLYGEIASGGLYWTYLGKNPTDEEREMLYNTIKGRFS